MPIKKIMDFFNYREIDTLTAMLKEQKETIACKKQELENVEKHYFSQKKVSTHSFSWFPYECGNIL